MLKRKLLCLGLAILLLGKADGFVFANVNYPDSVYCAGADTQAVGEQRIRKDLDAKEAYNLFKNIHQVNFSAILDTKPTALAIKQNIQKDILFFAGHGNYDHVGWDYNKDHSNACAVGMGQNGVRDLKGTLYDVVGLDSYDVSDVSVAIFAGCQTADINHLNDSITVRAASTNKIASTFGWKYKVNDESSRNWMYYFLKQFTNGKSMMDAANYADTKSYYDNDVKLHIIGGNMAFKLTLPGGKAIAEEKLSPYGVKDDTEYGLIRYPVTKDVTFDFKKKDFSEVIAYIQQNFDPGFSLENYNVQVNDYNEEGHTGKIYFNYCVGDFETNSNIQFFVKNHKAVEIAMNEKPENLAIPMTTDDISDKELMQLAIEDAGWTMEQVKNQVIKKCYDINSKQAYYLVTTNPIGDGYSELYRYDL